MCTFYCIQKSTYDFKQLFYNYLSQNTKETNDEVSNKIVDTSSTVYSTLFDIYISIVIKNYSNL